MLHLDLKILPMGLKAILLAKRQRRSVSRAYRPPKAGRGLIGPSQIRRQNASGYFRTRFERQHPAGLGRRALPQPYKERFRLGANAMLHVKGHATPPTCGAWQRHDLWPSDLNFFGSLDRHRCLKVYLCNVSDQKERKSLEDKYSPVEKAGKFIAG